MTSFIYHLYQLCLFRDGPQNMPFSPRLLISIILCIWGMQLVIVRFILQQETTYLSVSVSIFIHLGLLWVLLSYMQKKQRWLQTAIAINAVNLVFSFLAIPILLPFESMIKIDTTISLSPMQVIAGWASIGFFVWQMRIHAHIFRHACAVSMRKGYIIAILLFAAEFFLNGMVSKAPL